MLAFLLVLAAAWSLFVAVKPEVGFFLEEGWKFRDAEPSDLYLAMTRLSAGVVGIACLVFAAVLAFGGLGFTGSSPTEGADPAPTRSVPPITVTAQPPGPETEANKRATRQCRDLLPLIEDESEWDPQGRLTNQDRVSSIVAAELATMTIASQPDGDLVTIRSDLPTVDKVVRPLATMTSSGATCMADRED